MDLAVKEDVLSPKECDFLLSYYEKYKRSIPWDETRYFRMRDIPFYHLRMWLWWRSHLRKVKKDFPFLEFNYGQIVHWPHGSSKGLHTDVDFSPSKDVGSGIVDWTVVWYLNDDFKGGETIVMDTASYPKKGKLVLFNSKRLMHGVGRVDGNRYTLTSWWKDLKRGKNNDRV